MSCHVMSEEGGGGGMQAQETVSQSVSQSVSECVTWRRQGLQRIPPLVHHKRGCRYVMSCQREGGGGMPAQETVSQ